MTRDPLAPPPSLTPEARARLAYMDQRDGFFVPAGGTLPISPTMAGKLHAQPRKNAPDYADPMQGDHSPDVGNMVGEAESYEGMRR